MVLTTNNNSHNSISYNTHIQPLLYAKKKNKDMCGTTAEMLPSYLDEFQWRQIYGKKPPRFSIIFWSRSASSTLLTTSPKNGNI
jgi:hypothetical protein